MCDVSRSGLYRAGTISRPCCADHLEEVRILSWILQRKQTSTQASQDNQLTKALQYHVSRQVDRQPHRAAVHCDLSGHLIRGSDMEHQQVSILGRLLVGHPAHYARVLDHEVSRSSVPIWEVRAGHVLTSVGCSTGSAPSTTFPY